MATRDLLFKFIGDSKSFERASDKVTGGMDGIGSKTEAISKKMGKFGKGLTAGVTLPIAGAFTLGFNSLRENEELLAQTNAVIDSMGGAAGKTADEVFDLANEISGYSGMAHEAVVEGQNVLMTFGNIQNAAGEGNDVFDQSTKLLADMSVALGTDMKDGAIQLGKALNDPIKGVSALSRVGVSFTEEQKEQIAAMTEAGDVMGAQKIILGELEKQFGGSAEALGGTMTGSLNKLKNSGEQLARTLASAVVPIMTKLAEVAQRVLDWFNNLDPGMQKVVQTLAIVAAAVGPVLIVGSKLVKSFQAVMGAFKALSAVMAANPWILLIAAVVALVVIIVKNWDKIVEFLKGVWDWITQAAGAVGDWLKDVFQKAVDFLKDLFMKFTPLGFIISHFDTIKELASGVGQWLRDRFNDAVNFIKDLFMKFTPLGFIISNFDKIKELASGVWTWLRDRFNDAITHIKNLFMNFTPLGFIISKFDRIKEIALGAKDFITDKFDDLVGFFEGLPDRIGSAVSGMWDGIKTAFRAAINWLITKWNNFQLKLGGQHVSLPFGLSFTIPSITLRTPNIPRIHTGGIFRAPTPGGEGLAILKDEEEILPRGAAGRPMLVQIMLPSGRVLAEEIIDYERSLA